MFETLKAGGPVMVPIGLLSVAAVMVLLERLWAVRRGRVVPMGFVLQVLEYARQHQVEAAVAVCRSTDLPIARIFVAGLTSRDPSRAGRKERLEEAGRREAADLERGVAVLGTVGSVGPLLGLLGTVLGMILTFQVIQTQGGTADASALAGGISQALVTTFAGLCVGIPAVLANRFLLARVDRLLLELEEASVLLLEALDGGGEQG